MSVQSPSWLAPMRQTNFSRCRDNKRRHRPAILTIVFCVLSTKANTNRIAEEEAKAPHSHCGVLRGDAASLGRLAVCCVLFGGDACWMLLMVLPELPVVRDGLGVCVCASVCFCVCLLRACGWMLHDGWVRRSSLAMTFASSCCCLPGNAVILRLQLLACLARRSLSRTVY